MEEIKKKSLTKKDISKNKLSKILENQIIIKSSENINNNSLKISFSKDKVLFFDKDKNRIR